MKALVVFHLFLFVPGDGSVPEKGPPLAQVEVQKIVSRVGEDLKIMCPVEGSPAPLVRWYKDDEVIDHTWTRIKATRRVLKIKNVHRDDTGIFLCKGVNGFGSATVRVELIVIDPRKYGVSPMDKPLELAPPVFTKKTQNFRTMFKKLPGDSIILECEALGSPEPVISWLHNGISISSSSRLDMVALNEEDSGTYSCVASNLVGRVAKEFSLTVSSPLVEVPVISDISNVSVGEGETGVMQCSVSSSVPAQVKWLREVSNNQEFTVSVANMKLVVVESGQISLGLGKYISNLVMSNVQINNQGIYVCFATNTAGGFNYKTATLSINPIKTDEMEGSTMVLALVIGLTAVVLILLVVLIICSITARRKILQPESPESSRTLMPPTPSTTRQTLTIQTNLLDFGPYDTVPSDGVHSLRSNQNKGTQNGRCSSRNTNHYEVPYSHQAHNFSKNSNNPHHQSDDYSSKPNISYHQKEDLPHNSDILYRQCEDYSHKFVNPYHQSENLKYQANIPFYQSENMLVHQKNKKLQNRNDSPEPGAVFRQHPYFQYVTVRSQGTESNHV